MSILKNNHDYDLNIRKTKLVTFTRKDKDQSTFHHIKIHIISCINKNSECVCSNEMDK